MKKSTDNTLLGDVLQIAHDAARQHNYADIGILDQLGRLSEEAFRRSSFAPLRDKDEHPHEIVRKRFDNITGMIGSINSDKQLNDLSRGLGLDTIVVDAVNGAQRARETAGPETQIAGYLNHYF